MPFLALSFLAGLLLVQQLPSLPDGRWLMLATLVLAGLAYKRYWRILFFAMGISWALLFAIMRLADRLPEAYEGQLLAIKGEIISLPEQDEKRARFDFSVTEAPVSLPNKLRLSWYYPDQVLRAGQEWAITVKLKKPHGSFNGVGFDYERWLLMEGIGATGYVRAEPAPLLLAQEPKHPSVLVWRQGLVDRLDSVLQHCSQPALLKALTIGDGRQISQSQWQVFRQTGTTHLVVISGSHIALVAGLIYWLILKAWARTRILTWAPQKVAAMAAIVAASLYSGLAGFSVPTQRALMMLTVAMLAIMLQRHTRALNVLMAALLGVLLIDPLAVLAAGFWLSFVAVAVILYVSVGQLGKPGMLAALFKINGITSIGLAPLLVLLFQQVSLVSPIANLFAVPVISFLVVPFALLAVLLMYVSQTLAGFLFSGVDMVLQGLWWLLCRLAELPVASVNHPAPSFWALLSAFPGVLLLLAPAGMPCRWLSAVLFLPTLFSARSSLPTGEFRLTLLDVGQGLSAVVQTAGHRLVFDTGGKFSAESDSGQSVLLPFLRAQGVSALDALVISHGDNDHIGGAQSLLADVKTAQIFSSVPQQLPGYSVQSCQAGQHWVWDEVSFTMLSPAHAFSGDNDNSCVLKVQSAQGAVLLTGDIEAGAEQELVNRYGKALAAQVLVAPHHGSQTSSTLAFLQAVQPSEILIPAGYRNQFGHPHQSVLDRYRQVHAHWLTSADSGAISVTSSGQVQALRATAARYWNNKPKAD